MIAVAAAAALTTALLTAQHTAAEPAKNIILMISDGAGDTTWTAANQWLYGPGAPGQRAGDQPDWQTDFTQHWMSTFPGHTQPVPPSETGGALLPISLLEEFPFPQFGSYDPTPANDDTPATVNTLGSPGELGRGTAVTLTPNPNLPSELQPFANAIAADTDVTAIPGFAAYDYLTTNSITDSAAAGTALATGVKSYNGSINFDTNEQPLPFITQQAKALGKTAGVVTTKEFTDATPAAFGTNSPSRQLESFISDQMINNGLLDVIISPGHPEFGSGGTALDPADFNYSVVSEANLAALRDGTAGWDFVDDADQLAAIGEGAAVAPDRLFGLVPVRSALHSRDTAGRTNAFDPTVFDPADPNGAVPFVMPDLDVLTQAAINTLQQDDDGFFLMVEGASVDSAAHANDLPRLIEEQLSFNRAVDQVIDWVEAESSWDETLLIITTDHANGLLLGPDSDTVYFQDPVAGQIGELPEAIWWSTEHTNELVPLWALGPGSELFADLLSAQIDDRRGRFIDNTDVYHVMSAVIPEPTAALLLAATAFVLMPHRRVNP
ncbi:MAG: alkaline phosphatase [Planctomycetota bacterium]